MSLYCPKDGDICIDDLCRGCGNCLRCGEPMMEKCPVCGVFYSSGGVAGIIECNCPPDDHYYEEDPFPNED